MALNKLSLDKDTLSNPGFYRLLLYALVLGGIAGLGTSAFLLAEHWLTDVIWDSLYHRLGEIRLFSLLICSIGGLLLGIGRRFLGDYPKPMHEALEDVRTEDGFDVQNVPHGFVLALISLSFGGALGPEAALIGIAGGLGTWVAQRLKVGAQRARLFAYLSVSGGLSSFLRSPLSGAELPLEYPDGDELPSAWVMIPGVVAGAAGLLVFLTTGGQTLGFTYDYLPYTPPGNGLDVLLALPLGLLGGLLGWLFSFNGEYLTRWLNPILDRKILSSLLGGIVLGLLATVSPLVLFSGQRELNELFVNGAQIGSAMLLLIALMKIVATRFLLVTGWKGGEIFPLIFAGGALGLAVAYWLPFIDPMVALAAVMAGATTAMLRRPLATVLILIIFLPASVVGPLTVGGFVGAAVIRRTKPQDVGESH
ncbi:MAG: chloride channel protein [Chloroflexi bacterium]|nr:MAG: chloride channel protein [Chloroflexota bacterium]MBL1196627.1 chloride channel protein [Chloroflexota bacterium]NOH13920.1 chloride channel protein [Chloroflexota bacterium]